MYGIDSGYRDVHMVRALLVTMLVVACGGEGKPAALARQDGQDAGTTFLLRRPRTPEDREAERDQPRPGVWAGEPGADLRSLTQDETNALVRRELLTQARDVEAHDQLLAAVGGRLPEVVVGAPPSHRLGMTQRGGIDSDPLVRVLARRAWGDRDRTWFELRGVRKGERIAGGPLTPVAVADRSAPTLWDGTAMQDALPGQPVLVDYGSMGIARCTVGEQLRPSRQYPPKTSFEDWSEEALKRRW
jgi:hypothetical protein